MSDAAARGPRTTVRTSGRMADSFGGESAGPRTANGIVVDGVATSLDGQPPRAQGGGWWPPRHSGNNTPQ